MLALRAPKPSAPHGRVLQVKKCSLSHGSILSRVEASSNPGAVQTAVMNGKFEREYIALAQLARCLRGRAA